MAAPGVTPSKWICMKKIQKTDFLNQKSIFFDTNTNSSEMNHISTGW
jgi:hypothetical protein